MSTRCQVQVIEIDGNQNSHKITICHHTDGYPEYMIPKIFEAFCYDDGYYGAQDLNKRRAGKVASLLCWADPGVFEPEDNHAIHGDINFFYRLFCCSSNEEKNVAWEIEVFKRKWDDDFDENWNHDQILDYFNKRTERILSRKITIDDFKLIQERQSIVDLIKKYT